MYPHTPHELPLSDLDFRRLLLIPFPELFGRPIFRPLLAVVQHALDVRTIGDNRLQRDDRAVVAERELREVELRRGLSVLLPQAIGLRRAIEMSLTGNFIDAAEAHRLGLVNHVVDHDELIPTARRLARDIVGNDQGGVRELLASYRAIHRMTVGEGERHETRVGREWARSYNPANVEARRQAIQDRGRTQV